MDFTGYIGQERIKRELTLYANAIKGGRNLNLLIAGKSGHGKTTLVQYLLREVNPDLMNTWSYIPDDSGQIDFDEDRRFHFIDEAHLVKDTEQFYPKMDEGKHTFILATNEYDKLKEPVVNRCYKMVLDEYTKKDLVHIAYNTLVKLGTDATKELCTLIADYSRNNPRVTIKLSEKVSLGIHAHGYPSDLKKFIEDNFAIYDGGFTQTDNDYLHALKRLGGRAGLDTLQTVLHLPRKVIIHDIEPFLIHKGLLQITARGRKLMTNSVYRS